MKCVGHNFKMLVTILAVLVGGNIHYLFTLASDTNFRKMSTRLKFSYRHPKIVTYITVTDYEWPHRITRTGRSLRPEGHTTKKNGEELPIISNGLLEVE